MSRDRGHRMSACKSLVAACEKAGFKRGTTPQGRKEFHHNCLMPIFTTGGFLGESFDPKMVSNCKAIFQKRKKRGQKANQDDRDENES